jgi:single-strand DNA-binding protein
MPEIGVNRVILIGRAGADAELRYTSNGKAVANFSLAINESFKNGDGEQRERVQWVRCVAWGRPAEVCAEFLTKGKQLSGAHDNRCYAEHAIMGSKQVGTAV